MMLIVAELYSAWDRVTLHQLHCYCCLDITSSRQSTNRPHIAQQARYVWSTKKCLNTVQRRVSIRKRQLVGTEKRDSEVLTAWPNRSNAVASAMLNENQRGAPWRDADHRIPVSSKMGKMEINTKSIMSK
jgi:hypothetical protein